MQIVLISCVAKKKESKSLAKDIYISPLFKGAYSYAKKLNPDKIFILSAKYGLLEETDIIEPYNETLNTKKQKEIRLWSDKIISELEKKTNLHEDQFIILAGEKYRKYLLCRIKHYSIPLKGLSIGKQLAFYKRCQ